LTHLSRYTLIATLVGRRAIDTMQQTLIHITASKFILDPIRRNDSDIVQCDVGANIRTAANHITTDRLVLGARSTMHVVDRHAGDGEIGWVFVAKREVGLAVALRDFDGVVDIGDGDVLVRDVVNATCATAALKIAGEFGRRAGPDFDACAVGSVEHGDVVDLRKWVSADRWRIGAINPRKRSPRCRPRQRIGRANQH